MIKKNTRIYAILAGCLLLFTAARAEDIPNELTLDIDQDEPAARQGETPPTVAKAPAAPHPADALQIPDQVVPPPPPPEPHPADALEMPEVDDIGDEYECFEAKIKFIKKVNQTKTTGDGGTGTVTGSAAFDGIITLARNTHPISEGGDTFFVRGYGEIAPQGNIDILSYSKGQEIVNISDNRENAKVEFYARGSFHEEKGRKNRRFPILTIYSNYMSRNAGGHLMRMPFTNESFDKYAFFYKDVVPRIPQEFYPSADGVSEEHSIIVTKPNYDDNATVTRCNELGAKVKDIPKAPPTKKELEAETDDTMRNLKEKLKNKPEGPNKQRAKQLIGDIEKMMGKSN